MKRNIFILLSILLSLNTFGQLNPVTNVASPEIAGLGTYGQIPVSLYTGTPNINIPIYKIKVGSYSFPISFSYHLASVKPNTPGGCLGLGWNLIAGGYITRTVRGFYDEKMGTDGIPHGYYSYATRMKDITEEKFIIENDSLCPSGFYYPNRDHDISADEFSFSFFGYSGIFYYNEDKGWSVVSDQDIKVEFDEKKDFINLTDVKKRINIIQWAGANYHNRFFCKFTLITPDGCQYIFGGLDAMEFSIPYYGRNNGEFVATTWRLSKIVTPDHRIINFTYDTSAIMCDINYYPQKKVLENIECHTVSTQERGRAGFTGHLLFPTCIKSIETPNDTLDFIYFKDPSYGEMFPPQALFWDGYTPKRETFFFDNIQSSTFEFGQFLGENINSANDVAEKLKNNILHCIRVRNGASNRTYYFDYVLNNRRKLSKFTVREGVPMDDSKYSIPPLDSTLAIPEYNFAYYNQRVMPQDYTLCQTDAWGYYTNGRIAIADTPNYDIILPQLDGSLAEVLKEITYPTKGKTKFEYENHSYSEQLSNNRMELVKKNGTSGGLRIAKIVNLKQDGTITKCLNYYYTKDFYTKNISSGISCGQPVFMESYETTGRNPKGKVHLYSTAGFNNPVTNQNSPNVGYSSVIEEVSDAQGNVLGYTKYNFSNYGTDIYGETHLDEKPLFFANCNGEAQSFPYTSNSEERGKLMSKENYGKNGNLTSKTSYRYKRILEKSMVVANQRHLIICDAPQNNMSWANMGWLTKTHLYSYLPVEEKEVKYLHGDSLVSSKLMAYDDFKQMTTKNWRTGGTGQNVKSIQISYPYNDPKYHWMVEQHIISPNTIVTERGNDYQKATVMNYESKNGIPYVQKSEILYNDTNRQEQYVVRSTDVYGNPKEMEKGGMNSILIWGNKGQDLVAKIENAQYNDTIMYQLGLWGYNDITPEYIEANRHKLPFSHVYLYKYDNARRLVSICNPNGTTEYYNYDFLDRPREVYYYEEVNGRYVKRIKSKYDYGYKK